jgi:hypothetical protein
MRPMIAGDNGRVKRKKCAKTCYATRGEADEAIAAMARRFGRFTFKRPYRCGHCRCYHITSTPPIGARRKKW